MAELGGLRNGAGPWFSGVTGPAATHGAGFFGSELDVLVQRLRRASPRAAAMSEDIQAHRQELQAIRDRRKELAAQIEQSRETIERSLELLRKIDELLLKADEKP
jgi:septal ring factor EnvC (AmiA/AmiB activator)